jgi:type VI protein secretion system component VasF
LSGPSAPRPAREALHAFQRLDAEIASVTGAATAALERAAADPDPETAARLTTEQARAAFTALRRLLVELGAAEMPAARPGAVDRGYVLTCYADEALLHLVRWPGAALWPGMLLELALYGTEIAGERLLETAERMVALVEPARRDVAAALFLAFAAGFRGGRRGTTPEAAARRLQSGLFDIAMDRPAPDRLELRRRFAQAVEHTVAVPRRPRSRAIERAAAALALVLVGWLVAAHLLWHSTHADMARLADQVIAAARTDPGHF